MRTNFEMFSNAGNKACESIVSSVTKKILGAKRITETEIIQLVKSKMKKISEKHSEIYDTEPPTHIAEELNCALKKAGYGFELNGYSF